MPEGAGSDTRRSLLIPVWVAIIGGLVTVAGHFLSTYQESNLQKARQNHDLIVKLLDREAHKSAENLVWAAENGLIELADATVQTLKEDPTSAPISGTSTVEELAKPIAIPPGPVEPSPPQKAVTKLVMDLDASVFRDRSAALETLIDSASNDPEAALAAAKALSGSSLERLSANGRYNLLYFLARVDWTHEVRERAAAEVTKALDEIDQRASTGVAAVGPKTRALIDQIRSQIKA